MSPKKLILQCGLAPGDIVMLTAAVRGLHRCYPGHFVTDVRTRSDDLWFNNPFITKICDDDPSAEKIECSYPLINTCNKEPYHCLHGFIEFLNKRLNLHIEPTEFKGDIHLSAQEKAWYSQVHELTGCDIPFWIIASGGKYDVTIKWWDPQRYQEVVDYFQHKIQFVQVGKWRHHHPQLNGVIDLRGRTSLRELVRLVYHSQGVLCPVTALMHLAAAVERKGTKFARRPCVVVAGGREPAHWEAYPDHQFIHTNGALPCCSQGGCWKDRVSRLRDGDKRDRLESLCTNIRGGLPRCMDLITPAEVIRRIELYFKGGALKYLSPGQWTAASQAVNASARNSYDQQSLNLHSAGAACDRFAKAIPPYPGGHAGRGIVICGGGIRYFTSAWVCINMLRRLGCRLPIEFWHLGETEMSPRMKALLLPLGVECVDALRVRRRFPARILRGWELKPYAILHSKFEEVLLLDADNVPVANPEFLFSTPQFQQHRAVFWPDYKRIQGEKATAVWRSCGLRPPKEKEFETGQILVDKRRCWGALSLAMWFNENSDFYYHYIHGDKETFHLAFRKKGCEYFLVPKSIRSLESTMCQHDFDGRVLFQHRNGDKWDLLLANKRIKGFRFEAQCRGYIKRLQKLWDGAISMERNKSPAALGARSFRKPLRIEAVMISCPEREALRNLTLENLKRTDWPDLPVHIQIDSSKDNDLQRRQTGCAFLALNGTLEHSADYILFLEDDLEFNRYFWHNLLSWRPVANRQAGFASLYNPGIREQACDVVNHARLVSPRSVFGSQAFLLARSTVEYIVRHWSEVRGMQDLRISRLAGRLNGSLLYHAPSLVQHIGRRSVWGGDFHRAADFDPHWKRSRLEPIRH